MEDLKEEIKMEEEIGESFLFSEISSNTRPFFTTLDFSESEKTWLGFIDFPSLPIFTSNPKKEHLDESFEVFNHPLTPNSPCISSASCEDTENYNTEQAEGPNREEESEKTTRSQEGVFNGVGGDGETRASLKAKKKDGKREREARFAFMTKSEVDHLEDGYRWRKYGQKAVKKSPFPRSYYRCTSVACRVKKRVERSCSDPTIVVTTYEGRHTHPSPAMTPSSLTMAAPHGSALATLHHCHYQGYSSSNFSPNTLFFGGRRACKQRAASSLATDHGLLQDIVPSHMLKQE